MHFSVLIADMNLEDYLGFNQHIKKYTSDITINYSTNSKEVLFNLENKNLLVLNTNISNYEQITQRCKQLNIAILLICENERSKKDYDYLLSPVDYDELYFKLENYNSLHVKDIQIKKEQELSSSIINNINNPLFLTDGENVIFSNQYFNQLTSCQNEDEINGKYIKISNIFENENECIQKGDDSWLEKTEKEDNKVCIIYEGAKKYFTIQKIYLAHNHTNIILLNDISHEIKYKNDLFNLLYTDNLTSLPNRAKLIDSLQQNKLNLDAISIFDINSFKEINDFFGHRIGDDILKGVGELIYSCIKDYKQLSLYKFPADTYCITNTNLEQDKFLEIVQNISEEIYKKVFYYEQYEIDVRITAGISFSNKNNKLITADIALQSAKKDHKDYLVFYDELDKFQEYENNMLWSKKLKTAFNNDKIVVFYQPLINNKTMKVDKYECLVRLIDEDGKVISPFFFLDISKKSNQYTKLTKIVIEKSFKKFSDLPFEFSVNISYEDIEDPDFLDFIKEKIKKYNVSNKVVFEILEDENVKNYELLINFVDEIKALGCKVAIDDFGSGYSNFEHLLKMNVDYLKIDASLIKNIAVDENSFKITKTIVEFAKNLNLKTIAEFVENEEIFNITKELGTDFSQGYYFSAPIAEPNLYEFTGENNE
ncbi:EAL domain-containing protein [Arcobacter roscoffensis]|uniref:Bifunctional diguanylate cyclase/phosphodiesterase n=1 Tax=Arcobacter roscoffensis TaxID=2961520 RepID=A0ABY5DYW6_9BACT|nr:bifunctional diguanylate cyclase/phosphodiesterase [Arcobacter roscoffensis]UTJ05149.1 bifunctional diguanylate cyclase/phosphodiesterase [Arcobacter roscoffensis]